MNANSKPKVLVIDDEQGPRESLHLLLTTDYEVFLSDNVDDGVALFKSENPELVILDIRMPEKTGIEGLREIRAIDQDASVIILTGYGELRTAKDAIAHQASRYMSKPFDIAEMRAAVKRGVEDTRVSRKRSDADLQARELEGKLKKLVGEKDKMSSLGLASSAFAHDMRNPLMIVIAYVEMLSERLRELRIDQGSADDELACYLSEIEKNLDKCSRLSQDWNLLGKPDSIRFSELSLNTLMYEAFESAKVIARQSNTSLKSAICETEVHIMGEAALLERALLNLIKNAIQAASMNDEPGVVEVKLVDEDESAQILIRDNGCGIDTKKIEWIFDPFNTERELGQGFGLGLFITKEVVESHKGEIEFKSASGKGTTVRVSIPKKKQ